MHCRANRRVNDCVEWLITIHLAKEPVLCNRVLSAITVCAPARSGRKRFRMRPSLFKQLQRKLSRNVSPARIGFFNRCWGERRKRFRIRPTLFKQLIRIQNPAVPVNSKKPHHAGDDVQDMRSALRHGGRACAKEPSAADTLCCSLALSATGLRRCNRAEVVSLLFTTAPDWEYSSTAERSPVKRRINVRFVLLPLRDVA